jgi:MFS family permease
MVLYIAGIGAVYITANIVIVSSASKSDQGVAAGVFNMALQVGGSVFGLAILAAVAQAMDRKYGENESPGKGLGDVGYRSVYYSCMILSVVGLFLSIVAIRVPDGMSGSIWRIKADAPSTIRTISPRGLN